MNKNDKEFYFGIKSNIVSEGIFERFPLQIPAVGEHYWREDGRHCKMLLVGESNYFRGVSEEESVFNNSELWYKGKDVPLIPSRKEKVVKNWKGYRTFTKVYNITDRVLGENGIYSLGGQQEFAFYNYYLRPAGGSRKFVPDTLDKVVAGEALTEIISMNKPELKLITLEPNLVIFLSKKAYDDFHWYQDYNQIPFDSDRIMFTCHPAAWHHWNTYGAKTFEDLISEHWIKKA